MESSVEKLKHAFEHKIDWDIFNYLVDLGTKFEDQGHKCEVSVICMKDTQWYHIIYVQGSEEDGYQNHLSNIIISSMIETEKEVGLTYSVGIRDKDSDMISLILLEEYSKSVKRNLKEVYGPTYNKLYCKK